MLGPPPRTSTLAAAALSAVLLTASPFQKPPVALAAKMLSEDQRIAAQAWKLTDREFVDRNFADQDWFQRRQKMVKQDYASRDAVYDQIRSMLDSLGDKYTRFLTPPMYNAVYSVATGSVAGIGVELQRNADEVSVNSVVDNGPADKGGLRVGDIVEIVDGEDVSRLSAEEVAARIRGPPGSKVSLQLAAQSTKEDVRKVILERAEVKLAAVTSNLESVKGKKAGVIKIRQFSTETAADVRTCLNKFAPSRLDFLIFDLRGNTGGYFTGGIDLARLMLPKDATITTVTDNKLNVVKYETYDDGIDITTPVLLVVDSRTASASEIFSSAMQDNARAKLIGSRTFGKAVIQTVSPLEDGSAVVVTTARYRTPSGKDINQRGIEVDYPVEACTPASPVLTCVPSSLF